MAVDNSQWHNFTFTVPRLATSRFVQATAGQCEGYISLTVPQPTSASNDGAFGDKSYIVLPDTTPLAASTVYLSIRNCTFVAGYSPVVVLNMATATETSDVLFHGESWRKTAYFLVQSDFAFSNWQLYLRSGKVLTMSAGSMQLAAGSTAVAHGIFSPTVAGCQLTSADSLPTGMLWVSLHSSSGSATTVTLKATVNQTELAPSVQLEAHSGGASATSSYRMDLGQQMWFTVPIANPLMIKRVRVETTCSGCSALVVADPTHTGSKLLPTANSRPQFEQAASPSIPSVITILAPYAAAPSGEMAAAVFSIRCQSPLCELQADVRTLTDISRYRRLQFDFQDRKANATLAETLQAGEEQFYNITFPPHASNASITLFQPIMQPGTKLLLYLSRTANPPRATLQQSEISRSLTPASSRSVGSVTYSIPADQLGKNKLYYAATVRNFGSLPSSFAITGAYIAADKSGGGDNGGGKDHLVIPGLSPVASGVIFGICGLLVVIIIGAYLHSQWKRGRLTARGGRRASALHSQYLERLVDEHDDTPTMQPMSFVGPLHDAEEGEGYHAL